MGSSFSSIMLLRCLIGFGLSVAISATILDDLVPGMDFLESTCNNEGECFRTKTVLVDDTAWIEPVSQLKCHEPRLFYVDTLELNEQGAPNVDGKHLADALSSCEDKPLEDVCEFKTKGWLKANGEADSSVLLAAFASLTVTGEIGLVNKCLNLPDENEYDYTYEYDYYDYYNDNYDYRVRRDVSARRNRRQIKKGGELRNGGQKGKGKGQIGKGPKEESGPARNGGGAPPNKESKKGPKVPNKPEESQVGRGFAKKAGSGTKKKGGPKGNQGPNGPGAQNFTQILSNLGLSEIPERTVMDTLICLKDEARKLIKECGKNILSNTP